MDAAVRSALVAELGASFGDAIDKTPGDGQPAHVLLPALKLPGSWKPNPARALVRFTANWPKERPDFFIDVSVVDPGGVPPRNSGGAAAAQALVLGENWRQFSFNFSWPPEKEDLRTPTRAVQLWLGRFRLPA